MFNPTGSVVGKVNATDRDQEKTLHVKIKYSLKTGLDLFAIDSETGVITTVTNTLDREVSSAIILLIIYDNMEMRSCTCFPLVPCITYAGCLYIYFFSYRFVTFFFKVKDKHVVMVEIRDMDGAVTGLFKTGTATITVGDINDNPPTFSKTLVSGRLSHKDKSPKQAHLEITHVL